MRQTSRPGAEPLVGLSDQAAWRLQLLNMDGVASRQTPQDFVQFAVAVLFISSGLCAEHYRRWHSSADECQRRSGWAGDQPSPLSPELYS